MKYRMIIADDEDMLIQLIKALGHFEELGIEIVDECHDGEEAYQSILRNKPDFVLSDIQMPVYDGLELIEKVRKTEPDIFFVLLSGYRYFEYARTAIQLNVVEYLLKPVDEEQLNAILSKVCRMIDEKKQSAQKNQELKEYQNADIREKQKGFWTRIAAPDAKVDPILFLPSVMEGEFKITLPYDRFQILVIGSRLGALLRFMAGAGNDPISELAETAFCEIGKWYSCQHAICYYILLNYEEGKRSQVRKAISALFYKIRDLVDNYGEFSLNFGVSAIKTEPKALSEAFQEAMAALWGSYVLPGNQVIYYEQVQNLPRFGSKLMTEERIRVIQEGVRYLNTVQLADVFAQISAQAQKENRSFGGDMNREYQVFLRSMRECIPEDMVDEIIGLMDEAILQSRSYSGLMQRSFQILEQYIKERKKSLEEKNSRPIEEALAFIHAHYREGISLEQCADVVGVSSSYLSRTFKDSQKVGFNDYLTRLRLEESQKLLANSNKSIKEIAVEVGYCDDKYYSKVFKKEFGIKPTEYRRIYG